MGVVGDGGLALGSAAAAEALVSLADGVVVGVVLESCWAYLRGEENRPPRRPVECLTVASPADGDEVGGSAFLGGVGGGATNPEVGSLVIDTGNNQ